MHIGALLLALAALALSVAGQGAPGLPVGPPSTKPAPPPPSNDLAGTTGDGFVADTIEGPSEAVAGDATAIVTIWALDQPLRISSVMVSDVVRSVDGAQQSIGSDKAALSEGCETIKAYGNCQLSIAIKPELGPGVYKVRLTIAADKARKAREVRFERRAPWECAFIILCRGLLVGALVAYWLGGARDHSVRALRLKRVRNSLSRIPAHGRPLLEQLQGRLIQLTADWESVVHMIADDQVDELEKRPKEMEFLIALLPDAQPAAPLTTALHAVTQAMAPGPSGRLAPVAPALFDAARTAKAGVELALPPTVRPTLPFTVRSGISSALLAFRLVEHVVAFILALLFALVAMNSFYFKDPSWGSAADKVALFLVGFGAYAGSLASVSTLLGRAKSTS